MKTAIKFILAAVLAAGVSVAMLSCDGDDSNYDNLPTKPAVQKLDPETFTVNATSKEDEKIAPVKPGATVKAQGVHMGRISKVTVNGVNATIGQVAIGTKIPKEYLTFTMPALTVADPYEKVNVVFYWEEGDEVVTTLKMYVKN